ncbi:MAG: Maf family protein [Pseudomonadota bacterium]
MSKATDLQSLAAGVLLASGSPRRSELLSQIALPHVVAPVPVDETPQPAERPGDYVLRLSRANCAAAVAAHQAWLQSGPDRVVLAADTTVVLDDEILGKPVDDDDGRAMLSALSGRTHEVMTGVTLHDGVSEVSELTVVQVQFRALAVHEIAAYVASGEGRDKAGGYGIQGIGGIFASQISGSYSAVVGLPVESVETLLRALEIDPWRLRSYG